LKCGINPFEGNLGARTNAAKVVIGGESDHYPATFYISNPNNYLKALVFFY
jgi:hypothetical protein